MARRRALVVEADWRMRKLVRTNLEALRLEVVEAVSAEECRAVLDEGPCDLVVVDADLPGGNGWNLVAQLRRTPGVGDLPIIVLVSEPVRARLLRRFQQVGALVKPFGASDLVACVECALAGAADHWPRAAHLHSHTQQEEDQMEELFKKVNRVQDPANLQGLEVKHAPIFHLPEVVKAGEPFALRVTIGQAPHGMEGKHHIEWLDLYAGEVFVAHVLFSPVLPKAEVEVPLVLDESTTLRVTSLCNLHGVWEGTHQVVVQ